MLVASIYAGVHQSGGGLRSLEVVVVVQGADLASVAKPVVLGNLVCDSSPADDLGANACARVCRDDVRQTCAVGISQVGATWNTSGRQAR